MKEAFPKKSVIILDLKSKIDKDTKIYYEIGLRYIGHDILSIQVNDKSVSQAENCEVGIRLNAKIKVETKIYKQNRSLIV